jgi:hypothetical protein
MFIDMQQCKVGKDKIKVKTTNDEQMMLANQEGERKKIYLRDRLHGRQKLKNARDRTIPPHEKNRGEIQS